ncbi:MAG: hypothetical protein ACYDDH_12010 [Candidatus Desulforudaceae bacterium]
MAVTAAMVSSLMGELEKLQFVLEDYRDRKQETLSNEEDRDYPSEKRLDQLSTQIECLESALDSLIEAVNALQEY